MAANRPDQEHNWAPTIARITFLLFTCVLLIGVFCLLRHVLHAILLGILGATILSPLHRRIRIVTQRLLRRLRHRFPGRKHLNNNPKQRREQVARRQRNSNRLAALMAVAIVFCCIVIPLMFFTLAAIRQGRSSLLSAQKWIHSGRLEQKIQTWAKDYELQAKWDAVNRFTQANFLATPPSAFEENTQLAEQEQLTETSEASAAASAPSAEANADASSGDAATLPMTGDSTALPSMGEEGESIEALISEYVVDIIRKAISFIMGNIVGVVAKVWVLALNFLIMLFVMFYAFRDGPLFIAYLKHISPFGDSEQEEILKRIRDVSRAVFIGILGTAIIQALLAMLFFRIVGIPALFWGSMLGLCSLIPFVGTTLIWIPAVIYLFINGQPRAAIFLLVGCGGIITNIDNILRPFFMSGRRTGMSYPVLFFSILGGLQTFGPVGIVYGPMISGLTALCLYLFSERFKKNAQPQETP